jgi:hypothetical protein
MKSCIWGSCENQIAENSSRIFNVITHKFRPIPMVKMASTAVRYPAVLSHVRLPNINPGSVKRNTTKVRTALAIPAGRNVSAGLRLRYRSVLDREGWAQLTSEGELLVQQVASRLIAFCWRIEARLLDKNAESKLQGTHRDENPVSDHKGRQHLVYHPFS